MLTREVLEKQTYLYECWMTMNITNSNATSEIILPNCEPNIGLKQYTLHRAVETKHNAIKCYWYPADNK